ncbi:M20/M25/M40 family metallo-hydrolase, partial [candidate division WWE3 bacterium]|nr:M20/M25/M40 family metallo-hydrolase [candidate division WWE3 bacterium]
AEIDSPSGEEDAIMHEISKIFSAIGIRHQFDDYGNCIAFVAGKGDPLLLTAHVDTVEPGRGVRVEKVDGILQSVGETIVGADNKAGVAVILYTVETLKEHLSHRPLEIVLTRSEEIGNFGAVNLDYSLLSAKEGFSFDSGSPIGTITTASPFYNRFDITVHGKACHAAHPELGINPLVITAEALAGITLGRVTEITTANIGLIEGGTARNSVPDSITLRGEVRSFDENELETTSKEIINIFSEKAKIHGAGISSGIVRENCGFSFGKNDPLLMLGMSTLQSLQIEPILKESTGCYDANIFFEHGIKILNFGNGSTNNHTTEEQISTGNLELLSQLLAALITA